MLIDSYDAQGIKFGIVKTDDFLTNSYYNSVFNGNNNSKKNEVINELISTNNGTIINFNEFDGLTTEEIRNAMGYSDNTPIIFVIYSSFETINLSGQKNKYINILDRIIIRGVNDSLIDENIEAYMINNYQSFDKKQKKIANCFLQRYRYGTKEKTDEAIKQYIKK